MADDLKMVIKRFTRLVSSPFLSNGILKSHMESYLSEDPEFKKIVVYCMLMT